MCLRHLKKIGVTGTQKDGGRMIDEVGGAVRNKAMQGLEKVRFYIQVLWEATEGNAVERYTIIGQMGGGWMGWRSKQ